VNHDRRAADDDGQADPCLNVVAEIAQQQGSSEPREEGTGLTGKQLAVHEGQGRADHPQGRGRGEREAPA
jgi:hypothetical protein